MQAIIFSYNIFETASWPISTIHKAMEFFLSCLTSEWSSKFEDRKNLKPDQVSRWDTYYTLTAEIYRKSVKNKQKQKQKQTKNSVNQKCVT